MSLKVVAADLRKHAGSIDDCLTTIGNAEGASRHVQLGNDAYGLLCSWLPPILSGKHDRWDGQLSRAKAIFENDASALRTLADEYENTDLTNAADIEKSAGDLPDVAWG